MNIAILGATSQIAKDLIVSFSIDSSKRLYLFARRPNFINQWLNEIGLSNRYVIDDFHGFGKNNFDATLQCLCFMMNLLVS